MRWTFMVAVWIAVSIAPRAICADVTPVQVSLCNPGQLFSDKWEVCGLRLNILYGNNRNVYGLDVGVINRVTGNCAGIQIAGLVNMNDADMMGIQIAGLINTNAAGMIGIQIAGLVNDSYSARGVQIQTGLIGGNRAQQVTGVQIALAISQNRASDMTGVQLAPLFNKADHMKGLQIGLVNIAGKMSGVQIGLANIIKESPVAFFPIVNAHF